MSIVTTLPRASDGRPARYLIASAACMPATTAT